MSLWRLDESKIWWEARSLKNQVRVDVPVWFQIRLQAEFLPALEKVKWKIPGASSQSKDWTCVSCIAGRFFTVWATRKAFSLERSAFILLSPSTDWMRPTLMQKLQYFGHLMQRTDSLEKTLMPGMTEGRRREWQGMRRWMVSPTWWTWVWASSKSWWWTGNPGMLQSIGSQRARHDWVTELTNWPLWGRSIYFT